MVQLLTSTLAAMPSDHLLSHLYGEQYDNPRKIAHCFLCIDAGLFTDKQAFSARVSALMAAAKQHSPNALLPGDLERKTRAQREKNGIPLQECEYQLFESIRSSQRV